MIADPDTIAQTRQTSVECYHDAVESGLIGIAQALTLEALDRAMRSVNRPVTARELERYCDGPDPWKRLSELCRAGLVDEHPPRECEETGRKALTWARSSRAVHDKLIVVEFTKQPTRRQLIAEVARLEKKLLEVTAERDVLRCGAKLL